MPKTLVRLATAAVSLLSALAVSIPASAQPRPAPGSNPSQPATCAETAGPARAKRIVAHCLSVSTMTRPPCVASFPCEDLAAHNRNMCTQFPKAPAYCREYAPYTPPSATPAGHELELEKYSGTVAGDLSEARSARESVTKLRGRLEPLVAKRKQLAATLKTGRAEFSKRLGAARAAHDRAKAAGRKPNAAPILTNLLQSARSEYAEAIKLGQKLTEETAAVLALDNEISTTSRDISDARLSANWVAKDAQDAQPLVDAMSTQLSKLAAKDQTNAASERAKKAKATAEQTRANVKESKTVAAATARETKAALMLAGSIAAHTAFKDSEKLKSDAKAAQKTLSDIDSALGVQKPAARVAPSGTPSQCDIKKIDFRNFDYPSSPKSFRNGKATEPSWIAGGNVPSVGAVQYADLNGNASHEAIVFIRLPGRGPQGDAEGALHFFEMDAQCAVRSLASLEGPINPVGMEGKSYVYEETTYGTLEGQSGSFPFGEDRVEVKFVNGKLKEVKRVPLR